MIDQINELPDDGLNPSPEMSRKYTVFKEANKNNGHDKWQLVISSNVKLGPCVGKKFFKARSAKR